MKRLVCILLVLAAALPSAVFAFDLTINPYSAINIGDALASTGFPTFQTKNTGVNVNTTFDMKEAGKITAGLDVSMMLKAASTVAYDVYVNPFATYAIGLFSAKLELPLDVLSSTADWSVFPSFALTPQVKLAIDKSSSISGAVKATLYTTFNKLDLQPKLTYAYGPFSGYAALKIPGIFTESAAQGMTLTPGAAYKIGDFTLEGYCDIGNLNSQKDVSVTPSVKVSYATKVKM